MAFKKTEQSSVRVTPVGMPDLSGYKSFAKAIEDTAQNIGSIGTSMRKREFTEALLQAEIDGKTSGVTYDKDGNLAPLTNLNYGVADKWFGSNDARNLQLAYEKNAISSYALAIQLDSNKAANLALSNNPKDPNAIRASLDGYLEGLGDMPDKVRNSVLPAITSSFVEAENRAKAAQIQQARSDQEKTALESIALYSDKLARLFVTDQQNEENGRMIGEVQNNIIAAKDVLRGLGYTDAQLEAQDRIIHTNIAIRSSQQIVDDLMLSKDLVGAWITMSDIKLDFEQDPNVDAEAVKVAMDEVWNFRTKQNLVSEQQANDLSGNSYNGYLMQITDPEIDNPSIRDILDDPNLNEGHKYALKNVLLNDEQNREAIAKAAREAEQKIYDEQYDTSMIVINNPPADNLSAFFEEGARISAMYVNGQIGAKKYDDFINKFNKFNTDTLKDAHKEGAAKAKALMTLSLGPVGGYLTPPAEIEAVFTEYVEQGVITEDGPFTYQDMATMLNKYTNDYNTQNGKRQDLAQAMSDSKQNLTLTSAQISLMDEHAAPKVIDVDGVAVPIDLMSDDPYIREQSLIAAVQYSAQYPNQVHPQIRKVINDLPFVTDENAYQASQQFVATLASTMKKSGKYGTFVQNLERNGIDMSVLWNAEHYDFANFRAIYESKGQNAQRNVSALLTKDTDRTEYFLNQFQNIRGSSDFSSIFGVFYTTSLLGLKKTDDLSNTDRAIINNFETKYGVSLEDAILEDERIISLIQDRAFAYVANGQYESSDLGFRGAVIKSMGDLIGKVGIEEVGDEYRFTLRPIVHEAQKTAPEAITVDKNMIVDDVVYRINQVPSLSSPEFQDAASNRDNYFFEVNDMTYNRPSYDVYLKVGRENILVFPGYRFDFNHSYMNESYMKAMDDFQNDSVKRLWQFVPFIDGALLNQTFKKYHSTDRDTYSNKNFAEDMITFYNNNIAMNLGGVDFIDPDTIGDRDLEAFVQSMMTLGFR